MGNLPTRTLERGQIAHPTIHPCLTLAVHLGTMSYYRRLRLPGASYFFTVALSQRGDDALVRHVDVLRQAFCVTASEHPLHCDAMVVLPDHLHAVWTLPPGDADFSIRWRKVKARFTRWSGLRASPSPSKARKRECGVWRRRFWEHTIRDERDYRAHVEYCWRNPVKHGLVSRGADWPFSSIHRDIRAGRVPPEWAEATATGDVGK
ncbi:MAG: transposase [Albidovulum sp.]|uniref:REP-associated tyrosine transposase n=2 Tax=Paracoccaceae TaxID=31989 RepID=UPI00304F0AC7